MKVHKETHGSVRYIYRWINEIWPKKQISKNEAEYLFDRKPHLEVYFLWDTHLHSEPILFGVTDAIKKNKNAELSYAEHPSFHSLAWHIVNC